MISFQVSFFSLLFLVCTIGVVVAGFAVLLTRVTPNRERLARISKDLDAGSADLQKLRDAVSPLRRAEKGVQAGMQKARRAMANRDAAPPPLVGVAASFPLIAARQGPDATGVLADVRSARAFLEDSSETLGAVAKVLRTYRELLNDAPTMWPVQGTRGIITTRFGWTTNPFSGLGYLHEGVDIAWNLGTPITAAANGVVEQTGSNDNLGNFVTLRHKHGFKTQYLHLLRIAVRKGDSVRHGDVIGYLGNTGLSTGPHVDYRVRLGNNCLDPMNFLSIPPDLKKTGPLPTAGD